MRLELFRLSKALLIAAFLLLTSHVVSLRATNDLKVEDVMTIPELVDTGVSKLTLTQRAALNRWLNRYTAAVIAVGRQSRAEKAVQTSAVPKSSCTPAVESTISGEFTGWEGETIFKFDNGQIWQQAEYNYTYSYSYRPEVTIYQTSQGCRMKVEDEDETILVRRIR
jgi:hypothetical protein